MECNPNTCELLKLKQDFGLVLTDKVYPTPCEPLTLVRDLSGRGSGKLYFRDVYICDTLENPDCFMPLGIYPLCINTSPRFKMQLPLISIPKHSGVRIHSGNYVYQSKGCVLVGIYIDKNLSLSYSKITLERVIHIIAGCNIKYFKFS